MAGWFVGRTAPAQSSVHVAIRSADRGRTDRQPGHDAMTLVFQHYIPLSLTKSRPPLVFQYYIPLTKSRPPLVFQHYIPLTKSRPLVGCEGRYMM